jgi:Uma2 family endonuclease
VATTPTKLMTFAEALQVPDPPGASYELFHGELIEVKAPEFPHIRAQWQLRRLFESAAGDSGVVFTEMPYRPLPEYEGWRADVAYISMARWTSIDRWLMGAPELVAEVLSPSNTAAEILDKEQTCLENGALQFWVLDTNRRQVKVSTPDGKFIIYKSGQHIPLFFAPGASIPVDEIFA